MMAPTTAIDEIAFVSAIRGVCSSRDTRRMMSRPRNVASMKKKSRSSLFMPNRPTLSRASERGQPQAFVPDPSGPRALLEFPLLHSFVAHRRALVAVVLATAALVLLRSYIFVRYGPAFFDSDQAIVGLMAKHLSEGRGFPLFYYGQNYMLGVESWVAVPFFWLGGPTVAMLRLPLVFVNVAVALAAVGLFVRRGLAPWFAFVAVLPVIATTPICSAELLKARVSIEPFLYVLILWGLRRRAGVFGAVFCLACLHREFSALALPAIVVALWLEGRSWSLAEWLRAVVGVAVVWGAVDVLKWHVNTLGPAGGVQQTSSLGQEARILSEWL